MRGASEACARVDTGICSRLGGAGQGRQKCTRARGAAISSGSQGARSGNAVGCLIHLQEDACVQWMR
eukprot:224473-Lingulodinium_polyedra.AAC.1